MNLLKYIPYRFQAIPGICSFPLFTAISAAGSPFWSEDVLSLSRFMYALKSILRTSYAVCMLTVPGHLIEVRYASIYCLS